jgi:transcriptional regulator with XRE-family HTH domain
LKLSRHNEGKGLNQKQVAEIIGCSATALSLVIDRKSVSKRIMKQIAVLLDRPVEQVFPEYFRKVA